MLSYFLRITVALPHYGIILGTRSSSVSLICPFDNVLLPTFLHYPSFFCALCSLLCPPDACYSCASVMASRFLFLIGSYAHINFCACTLPFPFYMRRAYTQSERCAAPVDFNRYSKRCIYEAGLNPLGLFILATYTEINTHFPTTALTLSFPPIVAHFYFYF